MSPPKANQATLRRGLLANKTPVECLSILESICNAGAQCPEVKSSPVALQALGMLQQALTTAQGTMANKQTLAQALMAVIKALDIDLSVAKDALDVYQASVVVTAKGNASIINSAGLPTRTPKSPISEVGMVTSVTSQPWKIPGDALLTWPRVAGATGYAIEVNFTPQSPNGPWTPQTPGLGRRRTITAPVPGAQFLVRIAALGKGNTQSPWCAPVLATAR